MAAFVNEIRRGVIRNEFTTPKLEECGEGDIKTD